MGQAYLDGELSLAEHEALTVLRQAPACRDALGGLYNVCKDDGRMTAAQAIVQRMVLLYPDDPQVRLNAALFFLARNAAGDAMPHARMLVRLAPEAHQAHLALAQVFAAQRRPLDAEYHLSRALELSPAAEAEVLPLLAQALRGQGRFDDARQVLQRWVESGPAGPALLAWAELEEEAGRIDDGLALVAQAEARMPGDPAVMIQRSVLLRRAKRHDEALAELDALADRRAAGALGATGLRARAKVYEAMGRHAEAFADFAEAKRLLREQTGVVYGADRAEVQAARLKSFFTAGRLALLPKAGVRPHGPQPVFIVGFPRSGTTLVEQTLTATGDIAAGDELQTIHTLSERLHVLLGSPGFYPTALSELWIGDRRHELDNLRDHYLNEAARLGASQPDKRWFTDKMPLNETHLALIHLLFPAAPVVHLVRHPLDVVLSVFTNSLSHGFNCASALDTAARHYALTADLLTHYLSVLPLNYLPVRYEDLVVDQEAQVRRLFGFVGAPFDDRALSPHENPRHARTASYAQVSEKLYDRSRFRYRFYREQLAPVVPILEPAIAAHGYTIDWA
ncbi:sulfotransferase [Caulobacter sp. CCNWLY153]|uniref:tetratricopeptide repeat-containing sulfotransferase family protein n=1 Tax=unclassified Caulobacter TaxID=2648921 RepID=UPI002FF0CD15